MVNWTSIKMSDLNKHRYMRMDAKYWIQKALLKKRKKELEKILNTYVVDEFNNKTIQ